MSVRMKADLAGIIDPTAPESVRRAYATLRQRADAMEFGDLTDGLVVVDTETTGLDFRDCELIEVSAARMCGKEITGTFDMMVRPSSPIPVEITKLTGITNEMVADAEPASVVMARFKEFLGDSPLIAHNVTFDRHFLEKGMGGEVADVWIDSLELSRIVLPWVTSHKLHDLSRAFDLHESTHRALDDVIATCGLWRVLLTAASDLPASVLGELAQMHPDVPWSYRPVFAQLAAQRPPVPFSLSSARAEVCASVDARQRLDAEELASMGDLTYPDPDDIAREFTPDGIVGSMYAGYEPRREQVQMAREVAEAIRTGSVGAIEAGTGVGKSVAYLLPLATFAQRNQVTVGVATKTNALTDQLIEHELPLLSAAIQEAGGKELTFTALKGFDNYPCMRKLARYLNVAHRRTLSQGVLNLDDPEAEGGSLELLADTDGRESWVLEPNEALLNALAALVTYSSCRALGDINGLGIRWGKIQRSHFTSSSAECAKNRCPYFPNKCFLHLARRHAAACDVVVTNHSLLYRQAGSGIEVLPPIRYWAIDEAHSAEAEARRQWALRVNSRDTAAVFERMGGSSTGALGSLLKEARSHSGSTLMMGVLTKVASEVARASISSTQFFDDLKAFCRKSRAGRKGSYDTDTIWVNADVRGDEAFGVVMESACAFLANLDRMLVEASGAVELINDPSNMLGDTAVLKERLEEFAATRSQFVEIRDALRIITAGTDDRYVYSASGTQRSGFEAYELTAEAIDVGAALNENWYPQVHSVVYTSATIAVGQSFDHFRHQMGLDRPSSPQVKSLHLDSSYDFRNHMQVVVAQGLPDPSRNNAAYLDALVPMLIDVHQRMGGSVLTLWTSRAEMERAYAVVQPILAKKGLELAMQSRGSNVRRITDHFVADQKSSLFALKSFWEGFDAPGDTLRCVVIPRLPFTPPTDPLSQERKLREGSQSWKLHDLPEAVLTFKQAAGRLIRCGTDEGCLVLADPRLEGMWYGSCFMKSLPPAPVAKVRPEAVGATLEAWNNMRSS